MLEHFFTCPYCFETISMLLDPSTSIQHYIEDCEVCCNPIEIKVTFFNNELSDFQADTI